MYSKDIHEDQAFVNHMLKILVKCVTPDRYITITFSTLQLICFYSCKLKKKKKILQLKVNSSADRV